MRWRGPLMLGAGFAVWASAFVTLYAMLSVGCRFGWDGVELFAGLTLQRAQLAAILLLHLAAGAALAAALRPRGAGSGPFLHRTAFLSALAALGATVFSFAAVFGLTPCA